MANYPVVTTAIQKFLEHTKNTHNADLVDRYCRAMETQVNVHPGDGQRNEESRNTYTNGTLEWFNFRIPKRAMDQPEHSDWQIKWPMELYADGIGMTGWSWEHRLSLWVAYDFDSITEHAKGVGIAENDLIEVAEKAKKIPWVQVRKSTGGGGLHLYVYFNPVAPPVTQNHTEHAALARAVLGMMSAEAGFDFQSRLDVCGSNMWIWHTKMTEANEGLKVIKQNTYDLMDWPLNWKDHLPVITRQKARIGLAGVEESDEGSFDKLSNSRTRIPLDDTHKALIAYLDDNTTFSTIWNSDHHCLQTHSSALLAYATYRMAKGDPIRGFYNTTSGASDPNKPNCFAFPMENGAWKIIRFGRGVNEASTWQHDKENWTWCFFNRKPDLAMASLACSAQETVNRGYEFNDIQGAQEAISHLGSSLKLPANFEERKAAFKSHKDGRLIVTLPQLESDREDIMRANGWVAERGKKWEQIYNVQTRIQDTSAVAPEIDDVDGEVRAINNTQKENTGFMLKHIDGDWILEPLTNVKNYLKSRKYTSLEADAILGDCNYRAWTLVNIPFGEEYPGNREWNRDAAQLRYTAANVEPTDIKHPHWDQILRHCGNDLDSALAKSPWARKHGVKSGMEYLTMWIASIVREPYRPLPYLFFYGEQECGKSIFHEAITLLCTKGCVDAGKALVNTSGFNGELYEAVLCYIEELDLSKLATMVYNRIKEFVTDDRISIHKKFMQPFMAANTTHWIQVANKREFCPIFPGDTRIMMMYVPTLAMAGLKDIPKDELKMKLMEEAPHFMRTLIDLQLPPATGRLRLPVITTNSKQAAEESNRDALEVFLEENTYYTPGARVDFKEFFMKFQESIPAWEKTFWQKRQVGISMPQKFPVGAGTGNKRFIGNMSFDKRKIEEGTKPLVLDDKRLVESDKPYLIVNDEIEEE